MIRMPLPEMPRAAEADAPGAAAANGATDFNPLDALRIVRAAGGALLEQAALHAQLAQVEFAEEKNRLLKMHWITLAGFAFFICALLSGGALLLALSWDTPYRVPVSFALSAVYAFGVSVSWRRFQAQAQLGGKSFAATRDELSADIALLKSKL